MAAFWGPFEIVFLFQGLGNTMGQPLNFTAGIIDARAAVQTTVQPPKQTTVQVNKSALLVISLSLTYMYDIQGWAPRSFPFRTFRSFPFFSRVFGDL